MSYRTVELRIKLEEELAKYALLTAKLWRQGVEEVWKYMLKHLDIVFMSSKQFAEKSYKLAYKHIPHKYYARKCCELCYEVAKSLLELSKFFLEECEDHWEWYVTKLHEVKFGNWKMFESRADASKKGNLCIRLLSLDKIQLKLFTNKQDYRDFVVSARPPKDRKRKVVLAKVLELALDKKLGYDAKFYIDGWRDGKVFARVQITVPLWLWSEIMQQFSYSKSRHVEYVVGVDINSDRLNFILIDEYGNIVDKYTLWLTKVKSMHGYRKKDLVGLVGKEFVKLIGKWCRYSFALAVEDPERLSRAVLRFIKLKLRGSAYYNWKVMTFSAWLAETLMQIAERYGVPTIPVNPWGTTHSEEHDEIMRKFGLDRHMASAYIIAKRALTQLKQDKNMQTYSCI